MDRKSEKLEMAHAGLAVSAAAAAVTAFFLEDDRARKVHIASLAAFVGFSMWKQAIARTEYTTTTSNPDVRNRLTEHNKYAIKIDALFAEISINGTLTLSEYNALDDKIRSLLACYQVPTINTLIDIRDLRAVELRAILSQLRFFFAHHSQIKRLAIVGRKKRQAASVALANKLVQADLRFFSDPAEARHWFLGADQLGN